MTPVHSGTLTRRHFIVGGFSLVGALALSGLMNHRIREGNAGPAGAIPGGSRPTSPQDGPDDSFMDLTVSHCGRFHAEGYRVYLKGTVSDAVGNPLPGVRVILLQPAANGSCRHPGFVSEKRQDPGFRYYGACLTNQNGGFRFLTVLPGEPLLHRKQDHGAEASLAFTRPGHRKRIIRISRNVMNTETDEFSLPEALVLYSV